MIINIKTINSIIIILTFRRRATRVCGWQVDKCTLQLRNNSLPTSSSSRFHHHHHHHHRHHHHHNYHHHRNLIITINILITIFNKDSLSSSTTTITMTIIIMMMARIALNDKPNQLHSGNQVERVLVILLLS